MDKPVKYMIIIKYYILCTIKCAIVLCKGNLTGIVAATI